MFYLGHLESHVKLRHPLLTVVLADFLKVLSTPIHLVVKSPPHSMPMFLSSMGPDSTPV